MIVEHSFVTTLDAPEAFTGADALLRSIRFRAAPANGASQAAPASREWVRGVAEGRHTRGVSNRTTHVRMDFDRGRVQLAVAITAEGRSARYFAPMAVSIATALDLLLAQRQPVDAARAQAAAIDSDLLRSDRRRRVVVLGVLTSLIMGIAALIGMAVGHSR